MAQEDSVIVAGGGLIGSVVALGLAYHGIPVVLIEKQTAAELCDSAADGRTTALSQGSFQILQKYDLIDEDLINACEPILDIRIAHEKTILHYPHTTVSSLPMGYIVPNSTLRQYLWNRVNRNQLIRVVLGSITELAQVKQGFSDARIHIKLSNEQELQGKLLIGADGRASKIRELCNISYKTKNYDQSAIVGVVSHELSHDGMAFETFLNSGPLALLPMQGRQSSLVWTEPHAAAKELSELPPDQFNRQLQSRFGDFLGGLNLIGNRWLYPLYNIIASTQIATRTALVGDSAHVIHPIAGQGLNLGMRDVDALLKLIKQYSKVGLDIGSYTMLNQYNLKRIWDVKIMSHTTNILNQLFTSKMPSVHRALSCGLQIVEELPPLKRYFIKHAMGV